MTTEKPQISEAFITALAEFIGGANQVRMSIALNTGGQLGRVAEMWARIRREIPGIMGYPTVEETKQALREYLGV